MADTQLQKTQNECIVFNLKTDNKEIRKVIKIDKIFKKNFQWFNWNFPKILKFTLLNTVFQMDLGFRGKFIVLFGCDGR